jgi:hypothetical protein
MTLIKIGFVAAVAFSGVNVFAQTTTSKAVTDSAFRSTVNIVVPDVVRSSFETKYPDATNTTWLRATAMQDDYKDMYSNTNIDTSNYYATYRWNDIDYYAWYTPAGEWIKTTSTINNDKLPEAVTSEIRHRYEGYEIVKVDEHTYLDGIKYEVKLRKGDEKIKIHLTPTGEILKLKEKQ